MSPEFVAMSVAMHTARGYAGTIWDALLGALAAVAVLFILYMIVGFIGVIIQDVSWWLRHRRKR